MRTRRRGCRRTFGASRRGFYATTLATVTSRSLRSCCRQRLRWPETRRSLRANASIGNACLSVRFFSQWRSAECCAGGCGWPREAATIKIMIAASSCNLCVLYLDFDGVLHPEDVNFHPARGAYLGPQSAAAGHKLFEYAQQLTSVLAPYPDAKIVLSTSWVQHRSYSQAMKRLPVALQQRVIGATFHDGQMSREAWFELSRRLQVLGDVGRRRPRHLVALDDDAEDWPKEYSVKLVKTDHVSGLARLGAVDQLRRHLNTRSSLTEPNATVWNDAVNVGVAEDFIPGLKEALTGQYVSDDGLDEALGVASSSPSEQTPMNFDTVRHLLSPLTEAEVNELVRRHGGVEDGVSLDDVGLREIVERIIAERQRDD